MSLELKVGDMPEPCFLGKSEELRNTDDSKVNWLGMKAYGLDGTIKEFAWWANDILGDINVESNRKQMAALIARIKLEHDAEAAIGPAINLKDSNPTTGEVLTIERDGGYGVYIDLTHRPGFNFYVHVKGLESAEDWRLRSPKKFEEIYQQALKFLPYDKKGD